MPRVMSSLTDKHLLVWEALAKEAGVNKSAFLREMIQNECMRITGRTYDALYDYITINRGAVPRKSPTPH